MQREEVEVGGRGGGGTGEDERGGMEEEERRKERKAKRKKKKLLVLLMHHLQVVYGSENTKLNWKLPSSQGCFGLLLTWMFCHSIPPDTS